MEEADTPTTLRRRNSITTTVLLPKKSSHFTTLPNAAVLDNSLNVELISLSPSSLLAYTSLKDLLPCAAAVNSPTSSSPAGEISIRNRLVKQAAWAYLQPALSASGSNSSSHHFFRRIWLRFSAGLSFINQFFDRFVRFVWFAN